MTLSYKFKGWPVTNQVGEYNEVIMANVTEKNFINITN